MGIGRVVWTTEDILNVRPDWTKEKAERFMRRHEFAIVDVMVEYVYERIKTLADNFEEEDQND